MPKKIDITELNTLKSIIEQMEKGASVSELLKLEGLAYTRRTLQRRLEDLLSRDEISYKGDGRGRRYHRMILPPQMLQPILPIDSLLEHGEELIFNDPIPEDELHLSPESRELKRLIEQPISERAPVGHNPGFLISYIPNHTYYLPESTRKELNELAQSGTDQQPNGSYLRQIQNRVQIDLSWNSSRLDSNSYSLLETEQLIEHGETSGLVRWRLEALFSPSPGFIYGWHVFRAVRACVPCVLRVVVFRNGLPRDT